jgi:hypothetical protein
MQIEYSSIVTFEDCIRAGYPSIPTYPEQCKIPGKVFTNTVQVASRDIVESTSTFPEKNMNPKNTSYDIEGIAILLQNGKGVYATSTSEVSSSSTVEYFGNDLRVDLNNDSKEDAAFFVTRKEVGTQDIYYYLVVALNTRDGYIGTNGILIGDRITPQSIEFKNGEMVATYLDRKPDESMKSKPTVSLSRHFKITDTTLEESTQ